MNAKHTPGPWHFDTYVMPHAEHVNVWEFNGIGHVAAVSKGLTPDPSAQANARLIAAAPELLEALSVLHDAVELLVGKDAPSLFPAKAAIAKATGEEAP